MDDIRFGVALRAARIRRRWRQIDVAARAGVSGSTVSRMERGMLGPLQLGSIRAVAAALEVAVELLPRSRAAWLERVVNQAHATLAEQVVAWLAGLEGWIVKPEVSFSHYGERGVIDLLAWHADTRSMLLVELKTEIVDVGELLATFDRKLRNGREVATGLTWSPASVSGLLVIGDSDHNRRRVQAHKATFLAAFPQRLVEVRRWLVAPAESLRGLVFFANRLPRQANAQVTIARRIRRPQSGQNPRLSKRQGESRA